jgi:adenylate kinase
MGDPTDFNRDLLRFHKDKGTELGQIAKGLMEQGGLVPDDLVNEMVADRLAKPDTLRGYILDGFPRTLNQADWLDKRIVSEKGSISVVAVSIQVDYNQLLRRITGRRNCPVCGTIYNIYAKSPKVKGICDVEGAALVQRTDDTEAVFAERMKSYVALTAPVVDHYHAQGRFVEVNGDQPIEAVSGEIIAAVRRLRAN